MQGILKSNHQRLCDFLKEIKAKQPAGEHRLNQLEDELQSLYMSYQYKVNELKHLIYKYEENQKAIRNEIKRVQKRRVF